MNSLCTFLALSTSVALVAPSGSEELSSSAFEAYQVARNWVDRGAVPQTLIAVPARGVVAVHVTLRVQGLMVGQATAAPQALLEVKPDAPSDMMPLVGAAARDALTEARRSLATRGALAAQGAELALDLQAAYGIERLKLDSLADLPGRIVPHGHGLAMEREGKWAWSFPGNAVAANTDLNGQLNRLMADLLIPLDRKLHIGKTDGPALYRFSVIHITRTVERDEPVRLHRGNEPLPTEPLDEQALTLLAEQWADYLTARQLQDGRFAGTYEPTADQYRPETADAGSAAYAVLALARASKLGGVSGPERAAAARKGAGALVEMIGRPDPGGRQLIGRDLESTALTLMAILEAAPEHKSARDGLVEDLRSMLGPDGRFRSSVAGDAKEALPDSQALGAAALVGAFDQTRNPRLGDQATLAVSAAWGAAEANNEYRLLPWLALAERGLLRLGHRTDNLQRLDELCQRMWEAQVKGWGDDAQRYPRDAVGGFVVGGRIPAEPTAESAGVLCGLACAMGEAAIVPEKQRAQWLIGCGLGARFLDQLTLQPSGAYYTRNPREAVGGLRLALWDNRQRLRDTAAALLALTEVRGSLLGLAEKR